MADLPLREHPLIRNRRHRERDLLAAAMEPAHLGVECDECGENPIVGTRFKCVTRRNYDICRTCWQDNHGGVDDGTFVMSEAGLSLTVTRQMEPANAKRSIRVHSLARLASELDNDPTIEDVTFYPRGPISHGEEEDAKKALTQHTGVKTFHIYIHHTSADVDLKLKVVAEGLKENQSVFSVGFSIATNTQHRNLSKETVQALKDLMESNKTIRYFFVKRPRAMVLGRTRLAGKTEEDDLEDFLFDGLAHTSLQTFRYEAHRPVSDLNKKKAWLAMETNPSLRRICATFQSEDCQLELLTQDKKHQWMKRWAKMGGTDTERLSVLEEVRSSELEVVPALYRLVRGQPGSFLEAQTDSLGVKRVP